MASTYLNLLQSAPRPQCSFSVGRRKGNDDEINGIQQIRAQPEEDYKQLMAPILAFFLNELVSQGDQLPAPQRNSNVCPAFNAQTAPDVSVLEYLERIVKYTPCSPESFYIALIYLDRIISSEDLLITSLNVHRLLITSILIAAKIYDETTYNNKYYSHVGGISLKELNSMECTILEILDYDLYVDPEIFETYRYESESQILRSLENPQYTVQNPFGTNEDVDAPESIPAAACNAQARENALLLAKRIRRSRSFNNISDSGIFKWRKRRSSSFNVLVVAT